jgi:predicted amino acid racemase
MTYVNLDKEKLRSNFNYLNRLFGKNNIQWSIVSKLLCGNKEYLEEILSYDIDQVCDSRIYNLKIIKKIRPDIETIFIKPPAKHTIKNVIRYADISMNTEIQTIKLLSQEAKAQNKIHKVIIMIELGELREGIMRDSIMEFYSKIFELENIEVVGIGANLSCLYGVLPNHDKLIQLILYKQLIEAKFQKKIKYVSGGSSVTIPLILQNLLPMGVNHFRVGETLFLGTDVYNNTNLKNLKTDIFVLYSEIIELIEKPVVPMGEMGTNLEGHSVSFDENMIGETSYRAIVDIGLLDVDSEHIKPMDDEIDIVGSSSDMFVIDLFENKKKYKVGDEIAFSLDYVGILRVLHSKYIEKRIS